VSDSRRLLGMVDIDKRFPGVQALSKACLDVRAGEVHALLGENGAGKSTLMKVLCGQVIADAGSVVLDGVAIRPTSPLEAEGLGLVMIHQELNLVPGLTVAENIFLGHEPTAGGVILADAMRRKSRELLERVRCSIDPDVSVASLSVAEQQLVEIARALARQARLLVMDEPTAALADTEIESLFEVIRDLCSAGVPVIYISHRMPEIFAIAERVTVMRDGKTVGTRDVGETEVSELIHLMVGRTIAEQIPKRQVAIGDVVLEVDRLRCVGAPEGVSLVIRSGEILGVAGLMGSGRTALARAVFGADPIVGGEVRVNGRRLPAHDPAASISAGLGFLTEDRKQQGLVLLLPVTDNITLTSLESVARMGVVDLAAERAIARTMVERLRIRVASLDQSVCELSGGNQQKVVLARWLAARCRVLLFDEPTRGIDVGSKAEIYELIGELVAQGVAVLLVSSEMPELVGLADRIAVMREGVLQGVVPRAEATPERIMSFALQITGEAASGL
jgi:ribose transport system ATP-binding protein